MHAQRNTPLPTVLRDALAGLGACARPREVDHEDRLVVLSEDGERNVSGFWIVGNTVFVRVDLLEKGREAGPPRVEELGSTIEVPFAL